jgi:hypothetical protein
MFGDVGAGGVVCSWISASVERLAIIDVREL